ncbi:hypothetical protein JI667_15090 [Bacillus sp. NTK074B]|nr:hypothetical protein [Bacillus sp. NTK074B]
MNNEQVLESKSILIGRLFTLGGSVLFLIGSLIAAILAYNDFEKVINE